MTTIQPLSKQALESNVLQAKGSIVLDFYQASCTPCRTLEPRLERVADRYADRVPVYRIDIDRDLSVAEQFGVMSIPTVLVLRSGSVVERLDGLITESQLTAAFERASHV